MTQTICVVGLAVLKLEMSENAFRLSMMSLIRHTILSPMFVDFQMCLKGTEKINTSDLTHFNYSAAPRRDSSSSKKIIDH